MNNQLADTAIFYERKTATTHVQIMVKWDVTPNDGEFQFVLTEYRIETHKDGTISFSKKEASKQDFTFCVPMTEQGWYRALAQAFKVILNTALPNDVQPHHSIVFDLETQMECLEKLSDGFSSRPVYHEH